MPQFVYTPVEIQIIVGAVRWGEVGGGSHGAQPWYRATGRTNTLALSLSLCSAYTILADKEQSPDSSGMKVIADHLSSPPTRPALSPPRVLSVSVSLAPAHDSVDDNEAVWLFLPTLRFLSIQNPSTVCFNRIKPCMATDNIRTTLFSTIPVIILYWSIYIKR